MLQNRLLWLMGSEYLVSGGRPTQLMHSSRKNAIEAFFMCWLMRRKKSMMDSSGQVGESNSGLSQPGPWAFLNPAHRKPKTLCAGDLQLYPGMLRRFLHQCFEPGQGYLILPVAGPGPVLQYLQSLLLFSLRTSIWSKLTGPWRISARAFFLWHLWVVYLVKFLPHFRVCHTWSGNNYLLALGILWFHCRFWPQKRHSKAILKMANPGLLSCSLRSNAAPSLLP